MIDRNNRLRGIGYMILNSFALSMIYILMKNLTVGLDSSQVVFFYKLCCLIIIIPWVFSDGLSILKTFQLKLHILRGLFSTTGSLFFMYSLPHVKLVNATALTYLEQVLWAIIAIVFFNEKFSISKSIAIFLSFFGALTVIYPGLINLSFPFITLSKISISEYNKYYTFTLLAVVSWTANSISVKILGKTAKNKTQVFYALLFSSLFAFPVAFIDWGNINFSLNFLVPNKFISVNDINFQITHVLYFIIITIGYAIHSIAFFKAMKKANMSDLAPYHYLTIIFVGILGYLVFEQKPDQNVIFGYLLIIGSGVYLIRYEHQVNKRKN